MSWAVRGTATNICEGSKLASVAHVKRSKALVGGGGTPHRSLSVDRSLVGCSAVHASVVGRDVLLASPGCYTIPLLCPHIHKLPFASSLEVIEPGHRHPRPLAGPDYDLVEVHYVLFGEGQLVGPHGDVHRLTAGDSAVAYGRSTSAEMRNRVETVGAPTLAASEQLLLDQVLGELLVILKLYIPTGLLSMNPGADPTKFSGPLPWAGATRIGQVTSGLAEALLHGAHHQAGHIRTRQSLSSNTTPQEGGGTGGATLRANGTTKLGVHKTQSGKDPESRLSGQDESKGTFSSTGRQHLPITSQLNSSLRGHESETPDCMAALPHGTVQTRGLADSDTFKLPNQSNRLALLFGPQQGWSFSFGVEVFEPGHMTPPHVHHTAHELFFVLSGVGEAFCDAETWELKAGECAVFPPGTSHGINNGQDQRLYCLQMMVPNEMFVEFVRSGEHVGRLPDEDLCKIIAVGC